MTPAIQQRVSAGQPVTVKVWTNREHGQSKLVQIMARSVMIPSFYLCRDPLTGKTGFYNQDVIEELPNETK